MTVPADLDRRFREAAVEARLLDAGYDVFDSPVGPLLVAATDRGQDASQAQFVWNGPDGVRIDRRYRLEPGSYVLTLTDTLRNDGGDTWRASAYQPDYAPIEAVRPETDDGPRCEIWTIEPPVAEVMTCEAICAALGPPFRISRQSMVSMSHMMVLV